MWMSVEFEVPRGGMQHISWPSFWQRVLVRQWSFPLILMSPKAFAEWRNNQFNIFGRKTEPDSHLKAAVGHVLEILRKSNYPKVTDWRLFIHWAQRIRIQRIKIPKEIVEPPCDHILPQAKKWFRFRSDPIPNTDCRDEFWFGDLPSISAPEPNDGFRLEFKAVVNNWLYIYLLPWLGFIGFLIACGRLLFNLWEKGTPQ